MAFWGVEVKPGKPFRQIPTEGTGSQLHLSNAVLGLNPKKGERTVLKCKVGDNPEIFLASLTGGAVEACSLDIIIADDCVFSVTGSTSIHLTGYYMPMEPQEMSDDEYDDEYGEEDYDDYGSDDSEEYEEYGSDKDEEDESDEEDEAGILKHGNKGVTIEEITDDAAAANLPVIKAKPVVTETFEMSESEEEDEDGFERHHKRSAHKIVLEDAQPAKRQAVEGTVEINVEAQRTANGAASKTPTAGKKGEAAARAEQTPGASKEEGKKSKKQKKAEAKAKEANGPEAVTPASSEKKQKKAGVNGPAGSEKATPGTQEKAEVKRTVDKAPQETRAADTPSVEEKRVDKGEDKKTPKAGKGGKGTVREFPNGFKIEELAMGKPDGKRAEAGKRCSMNYVGKLAKNGKVFDASRGKPFSFRLGVGEVIKGWDKGVEGMRVGDKRRLTIPPSMGYGPKGAPPDIPGNATLMFDVELVSVK